MDESSERPTAGGVAPRRMRSWWRHEQQSIRMALGAAAHHSAQQYAALRGPKTGTRAREGEVHEMYDAPRRQNAPHPRERPGSLVDPGPQRSDRTVRRSSGQVPLLVVALLADASADGVDAATLSFLTASALEARRKEEEEWRKLEEQEELNSLRAVPPQRRTAQQVKRITEILLHRGPPRKRKKRRKRRTRRTSSLPGRARRRQRQCSACCAGFLGDDAPRVMFPSGVVWPKMLRIKGGIDQKDRCSGIFKAGITGDDTLRAAFLRCLHPKMFGILVGTDQQESYGDVGKDCVSLSLVWCSLPNVFMRTAWFDS